MRIKRTTLSILVMGSLNVFSLPTLAYDTGDLLVRGRVINISPDSSSSDVNANGKTVADTSVEVGGAYSLDLDFTYMFSPNLGAELLLDTSSQHKVSSKGSTLAALAPGDILSTQVLPPALILQYHVSPNAELSPYLGLGLNYTYFFGEEVLDSMNRGLGGVSGLKLDPSFGWVAQFGADYDIGNDWFFNADVKYMDIGTEASFTSGALGNVDLEVDINPWVLGIGVGKRF